MSSTPTRGQPFSQSSPAPIIRQTTSSSASATFSNISTPSPPVQQPQTITVDSLLKQHASASEPMAAALEHAVADRNVLSAQNSQLWKLIEKQRAGYNQILKELERIRGERDAYKAKLAAHNVLSANGASDKRLKSSRPSLDIPSTPLKHASGRHSSGDTARHHQLLQPSHSYDPQSLQSNANYSSVAFTGSSTPPHSQPPPPSAPVMTPARQLRPSPSPQLVPLRVDTSYAVSDSSDSSTSGNPPNSRDFNNTTVNNSSSTTSIRPLAPRKSSLADSTSSAVTSASNLTQSSIPASVISQNNLGGGNLFAPPINPGSTQSVSPANNSENFARQRALNLSPLILSTPGPRNPSPASLQPPPPLLSAMSENRPYLLSRESRISLPDEARQYIANMEDSPLPSPKTDALSPRSKLSTNVFPPTFNESIDTGRQSEFLDLGDEEEEEEEEDLEAGNFATMAINSVSVKPANVENSSGQGYNARNYNTQSPLDDVNNNYFSHSHSNPSREDFDTKMEKSRVVHTEFPLPPPSNSILIQRQQALAAQESQAQLYEQTLQQSHSLQAQESFSPTGSSSKISLAMIDPSDGQLTVREPHSDGAWKPLGYRSDPNLQHHPPDMGVQAIPPSFRALPLLSSDLPHTTINVSHSFVRPNDRGKEVLSFLIFVNPGNGKEGWKVEKMYSDVLSLDQRVRNSVGKGIGKKIANLPEGKLWKDHAPAKVDQRKAVLENYLQTLIQLPVKNNDEVIAFFTSDIVREQKQPVMQIGHKEGYLTKRGKNFGGWKTRFFVLQGPVLEYYDCRGGAHLGSITITKAQIARQHRTERDDEKEFRHAFLIVEAKRGPGGNPQRHVLCAESDEDRDSWVEILVRYDTGTYREDLVFNPNSTSSTSVQGNAMQVSQQLDGVGQSRSSLSSSDVSSSTPRSRPSRGLSREDVSRGSTFPISMLPPDATNGKLFQSGPSSEDYMRSSSPSRLVDPPPAGGFDSQKRLMERGQGMPSSLPDSASILSTVQPFPPDSIFPGQQRSTSEVGHYSDLQDNRPGHKNHRQHSPEQHKVQNDGRKPYNSSLNTVASAPATSNILERVPSPEKLEGGSKVKISGPMNGAPIPSGFKFGGKDQPSNDSTSAINDRKEKAKSRSFWGFGKGNGDKPHSQAAYPPRAVFGVPLEEALDVAQICNLPAIVFRSIQYLEAKKADQEEGIYRLSGSSAVIKNLKDMFNNEGDIDLLASDEYWDPHAIAGLLKSFLRELPSSILTRDLHLKFLAVIDFVDPQERIKELSQLIAALPIANYSLLRALTAHLILIVQNSNVNKMTMRNVGIVFSPTLGIPAGVFSLMLGEFNRVFNVDMDSDTPGGKEEGSAAQSPSSEPYRRNSRQYSDAAADQILGLSGRTLSTSAEETQSDVDDFSVHDEESGTETTDGDAAIESSSLSSPARSIPAIEPDTPTSKTSKASAAAASRGLNIAVSHSDRGNRHSRMIGLPSSPRSVLSPEQTKNISPITRLE